MDHTPVSLLERLHRPDQAEAWERLVELVTPLLFSWACRAGLQPAVAADLAQEVFTVLARELPTFHYDRQGSFRAWLRTVLMNRLRNRECLADWG